MISIKKLKLKNFKRFSNFEVEFDKQLNVLVGDNESGKSSIIEAINLILSGSRNRVESTGLENIFNSKAVDNFLMSDKKYENLPILFIELFFCNQTDFELNGKYNSDKIVCDGLRLEIIPNDELSKDIKEILKQEEPVFPFEFYTIKFFTFSGNVYSGYKKYLRHILVDNAQISGEYAIKEYVKDMYNSFTNPVEKNIHSNDYRKHKKCFKETTLKNLNSKITDYKFSIKNSSKTNLRTDLTLTEDDISIENKGKGMQCYMETLQIQPHQKTEVKFFYHCFLKNFVKIFLGICANFG